MSFPNLPFTVTLKETAHAESTNGVDWGLVSRQFVVGASGTKFRVISLSEGRVKIDLPLWDGYKPFWVVDDQVVVYTTPPTQEPDTLSFSDGQLELVDTVTNTKWTLSGSATFKKVIS